MAATLAVHSGFNVPPRIRCGRELRARREKLGLTLGDVAVESDVPLPVIAMIERGQTHGLDMPMISFFRIVMADFAFPRITCDAAWNDSTQYAEIFRWGGEIDIDPVRPLRRD